MSSIVTPQKLGPKRSLVEKSHVFDSSCWRGGGGGGGGGRVKVSFPRLYGKLIKKKLQIMVVGEIFLKFLPCKKCLKKTLQNFQMLNLIIIVCYKNSEIIGV